MPAFFAIVRIPLLVALLSYALSSTHAALIVSALRCENLVAPLGVDVSMPRLSWQLTSEVRGERQTGYQLLVASSSELLAQDTGDLWDSGRVASEASLFIAYAGQPPRSSQQVFWKVRAWDLAGVPSPWSEPAAWTMGILPDPAGASGWQPGTHWISDATLLAHVPDDAVALDKASAAQKKKATAAAVGNATRLLRREFTVKPGLRRALFHVSGLGHYELTTNGSRVGDGFLTPGWTDYADTCLYDTHDLTAKLTPGANAVGLLLASGLYSVQEGRYAKFTSAFRPLRAFGELHLEYGDGSVEIISTDARWRVSTQSPITFTNVYGGEDHDARLEQRGWDRAGFDDSAWVATVETRGPGGKLRGVTHASPPFRTFDVFKSTTSRELRPGIVVYDFGQNAAMMPRLRVRGPAGATVRLTPAELLSTDGSIDRRSVGKAPAYWQYTLRGDAEGEAWFPKFFYHGARYLQVERTSPEGASLPTIASLESVVVHSDSAPAGDFACSNELFNRIRTLIRWAQRSNLAHVITDCPHRERLGWLEQYHLNGPALRYEWDLAQLFKKTFADMAEAQTKDGLVPDIAPEFTTFSGGFRDSPEWGSAIILAAWQHLLFTGDDEPLRENYSAMQRYVAYLATLAKDGIVSHGLGDWYDIGPKPPGRSQLTPIALTATAIYHEDLRTLGRIADHLGRADDARRYGSEAALVREAFNRAFFKPETRSYATGSQTAQAMPLVLGLVEPEHRSGVFEALLNDIRERGHAVTAGDVGYRYLLRALADAGRSDVIFAMNNQSEKPGYGFQLARGATSLTEAWDANPTSSQNHFMLGQIVEWFYHDLAGIQPDARAAGFRRVILKPTLIPGLDWARASYQTPCGRVASAWKREGGTLVFDFAVPVGARATVFIPAASVNNVRESNRAAVGSVGVTFLRVQDGQAIFEVDSGLYRFSVPAL